MEVAVNNFIGGLNLDSHPSAVSQNNLTDALNATVRTYNGNELMLQNDMGNTMIQDARTGTTVGLSEGFIPLGMKEHGGVLYIASYNPKTKEGELGSIPSPLITYTLADMDTLGQTTKSLTYATSDDEIVESFANNTLTEISENIYSPGDCFLVVLDLEIDDGNWEYEATNKIQDFTTKTWAKFPVITKNNDKQHKGLFRIELYAETQNDAYLIGSTNSKNCQYYTKNNPILTHSNYWFILKEDLGQRSVDTRRTLASNNFVSYPNVPEGRLSIKAAVEKPEITGFIKNNDGLNEPFVISTSIVNSKNDNDFQYYMVLTALEGNVSGWPISKINIKLKETATDKQIFGDEGINLTNNKIEKASEDKEIKLAIQKAGYDYSNGSYIFVPIADDNCTVDGRIYYRKYFQEYKCGEKLYIAGPYDSEQDLQNSSVINTTNKYDPIFIYALADEDNYKSFTFEISYYYSKDNKYYLIDTKIFYYTAIFIEKKPYVTVYGPAVQIGKEIEKFKKDIVLFTPKGDEGNFQLMAYDGSFFIPNGDSWDGDRKSIPTMHLSFQAVAAVDTDAYKGSKFWDTDKTQTINAVFLPNIALTTRNDWNNPTLNWDEATYSINKSTNTMGWTWYGSVNTRLEVAGKDSAKLYLFSPRSWVAGNAYDSLLHKYTGNTNGLGNNIVNDPDGTYFTWSQCACRGVYDYYQLDAFTNGRDFPIDTGVVAGSYYNVHTPQDNGLYSCVRYQENGQVGTLKTFKEFNWITTTQQKIPGMRVYEISADSMVEFIRDCNLLTSVAFGYGYGSRKTAIYSNTNLSGVHILNDMDTGGAEFSIYACFELFLASCFHTYGLKDTEVYFKSRYHVYTDDTETAKNLDVTINFNRPYNVCNVEDTSFNNFLNLKLEDYYLTICYPNLKSIVYQRATSGYGDGSVTVESLLSSGSFKYTLEQKIDAGSSFPTNNVQCENGVLRLIGTKTQKVKTASSNSRKTDITAGGTADFIAIAPEGRLYIDLNQSNYKIDYDTTIQSRLLKSRTHIYYKTISAEVINSTYYNNNGVTCNELLSGIEELKFTCDQNTGYSSFNDEWEKYYKHSGGELVVTSPSNERFLYAKIVGVVQNSNSWDVIPLEYRIQEIKDNKITLPPNCVFSAIHGFNLADGVVFGSIKEDLFGDCGVIYEYDIMIENTIYSSVFLSLGEDSTHLQITNLISVVINGGGYATVRDSEPTLKTKR